MKHKQTAAPALLFYSYAPEDEPLREQLEKHLRLMSRQGLIAEWHNRKILPGDEGAEEINAYLGAASIMLLLVSPDFLASDYCYEVEMQQALERHKRGVTRVIPVILRSCDWRHTPLATLQCLPRNEKPVALWSNQDEAFLTIAQELRKVIEQTHISAHPLPPEQRENRTRLINRVRMTWIDGLLDRSLQQATWLDPGLVEQPDALDNPWEMLVQELGSEPRPLPTGTSIMQVYDQADGRLLILGNPGAGKTTLLLQLTRELLERAERDALHPLPVVFVLSSWAQKRQPLEVWLLEELKRRYHVPPVLAQNWLNERQILPLLDGLDEVAPQARIACVEAINTYIKEHLDRKHGPLVVTCRSQEYTDVATRLTLGKAVSILPLSGEQVEKYLQHGGTRVKGIRRALSEDTTLAEMAHTPLLLSVFVLAYLDSAVEDLPQGHSREETLKIVFSDYIRRMLRRRGLLRSGKQKEVVKWLAFIAKQMQHYNQTLFSLETLQAYGLPTWQETFYGFTAPLKIGLGFFLVLGPIIGVWEGLIQEQHYKEIGLENGFNAGMSIGLSLGTVLALLAFMVTGIQALQALIDNLLARKNARSSAPAPQIRSTWNIQPQEVLTLDWSWRNIRFGLICGLLTFYFFGLITIANGGAGAMLGIIILFILASKAAQSKSGSLFIKKLRLLAEKKSQNPVWKRTYFALLSLLAAGLFFIALCASSVPLVAITIAPPVWIIASVIRIARGNPMLQRTHLHPNEGTWRSGKNGSLLGLVVACALIFPVALLTWLSLNQPTYIPLFILPIGLGLGFTISLIFGLDAFSQHYILRLWLWSTRYLPWNIVSFLDEMVERLFLRRVGGSYIFIHRFLLDYFASLAPEEQLALAQEKKGR